MKTIQRNLVILCGSKENEGTNGKILIQKDPKTKPNDSLFTVGLLESSFRAKIIWAKFNLNGFTTVRSSLGLTSQASQVISGLRTPSPIHVLTPKLYLKANAI